MIIIKMKIIKINYNQSKKKLRKKGILFFKKLEI